MKKPVTLKILPDTVRDGAPDGSNFRVQREFSGGENLSMHPDHVKPTELIRAENVMISPEGTLVASHQMDQVTITASVPGAQGITGIVFGQPDTVGRYPYWHTSTPSSDTIVTGGYDPAANLTDINLGVAHGNVTGNVAPLPSIVGMTFAVPFLGRLYCPNAGGGILDLSVFSRIYVGGLLNKSVSILRQYSNYLWAVFTDGSIGYCNNGDATVWDPLQVILLPNREPAVNFIPVQGGAIVHSRTSIYAMYGTDYTDIQFTLLKDGLMVTDGAVCVDNIVYLCSNRGMIAASLNGVKELPHHQASYFKGNYAAWAVLVTGVVQGIYLYKYRSILYMIQSAYGTQGFMFNIDTGAFFKVDKTLPAYVNCMLPVLSADIDFLIYRDSTHICKAVSPVGTLANNRTSVIQTKHDDCDSLLEKNWQQIAILTIGPVYNVTIKAFLDYSETPIEIVIGVDLVDGDNVFTLDIPQSRSISFEVDVNATIDNPGAFVIRELRLMYQETGILL